MTQISLAEYLTGHPEWDGKKYVQTTTLVEAKKLSEAPDIPLPEDISVDALESAIGFKPVFITMPILAVDVTSRNGRLYKRSSVEALVEQINEKRVEGVSGHTLINLGWGGAYDAPDLRWLAADLDEASGIAYGKAVLLTEKAVKHFRIAEAAGAKVGVSLFGIDVAEDQDGAIVWFNLVSVDLVNAELTGIGLASANAKISSESLDIGANMEEQEKKEQGKNQKPPVEQQTREVISELADVDGLKKEIRSLRSIETAYVAISELLDMSGKPSNEITERVRVIISENADLRTENEDLLKTAISTAVNEKVKVESIRPLVTELVEAKKPVTRAQVSNILSEVLARPTIKPLLKEAAIEEQGGDLEVPRNHEVGDGNWKRFLRPVNASK